jgi:hypothetical protein
MAAKKAAGLIAVEEQGVIGPDGVARRLADSDSDPLDRVPYWAALVTYFGWVRISCGDCTQRAPIA